MLERSEERKRVNQMNKQVTILLIFVTMLLLLAAPVNAGFLDWLFKSPKKQVAKEIGKQEGKQIEKRATKTAETKTNAAKQGEAADKKADQLRKNIEKGAQFEKLVGKAICSQNKCFYTNKELADNMKLIAEQSRPFGKINAKKEPASHFFIIGGENTKQYIWDYIGIRTFNREPDFLEVTVDHRGTPKAIKVWDAKSGSIDEAQKLEYFQLCNQLHYKSASCEVEYIMPESEAQVAVSQGQGIVTAGCFAYAFMEPTPFGEIVCLLAS